MDNQQKRKRANKMEKEKTTEIVTEYGQFIQSEDVEVIINALQEAELTYEKRQVETTIQGITFHYPIAVAIQKIGQKRRKKLEEALDKIS